MRKPVWIALLLASAASAQVQIGPGVQVGGIGGGGATLPPSSVPFAITSTTSRAATASDFSTVLQTATSCTTSGYVYSPQSNSCVAPGTGNPGGAHFNFQFNNGTGGFGGDTGTTDGAGNWQSKSWTGTGPDNGAASWGYTGVAAASPAAHTVQVTQTVDPGSGYSLGGFPAALPGLSDSSLSYSTGGVPEWVSLHAPTAMGDVTPAPFISTQGVNGEVLRMTALNPVSNDDNHGYGISQVTTYTRANVSGGDQDKVVGASVYGAGINTGACPTCMGPLWTGWRGESVGYDLSRSEIDVVHDVTIDNDRVGDFAYDTVTINGVGGIQAAADEANAGHRVVENEGPYFTGTLPSSGVSQTYIPLGSLAATNYAPPVDSTHVIDVSQSTITATLNGGARGAGNNLLATIPITGASGLTATTQWAICSFPISPTTQTPRNQVAPYTGTCTAQISSGSHPLVSGWAKLGGNYAEGVQITVNSGTFPTYNVTVMANQPEVSGFTLWQGGPAGQDCWVNNDLTYTGQKPLIFVFGSLTGATDLIFGIQGPGALNLIDFPNGGNSYEEQNSAITCAPGAEIVDNIGTQFTGNTTAGSTTITAVSNMTGVYVGQLIYGQGIYTSGDKTPYIASISGSTLTINIPATATITGANMGSTQGIELEPHQFTLAASDNIENPHAFNIGSEGAYFVENDWRTPGSSQSSAKQFNEICANVFCDGESFTSIESDHHDTPVSAFHNGRLPNDYVFRRQGWQGTFDWLDQAPIPLNPSNPAAFIGAGSSHFIVTGTTNGTTAVSAVTGMPNPTRVCSALIGQYVTDTDGDIPANTTLSACTATSITLSQAATGSHSGDTLSIFYFSDLFYLPTVGGAAEIQYNPSGKAGTGLINVLAGGLQFNSNDVLTTASSIVASVLAAHTIANSPGGSTNGTLNFQGNYGAAAICYYEGASNCAGTGSYGVGVLAGLDTFVPTGAQYQILSGGNLSGNAVFQVGTSGTTLGAQVGSNGCWAYSSTTSAGGSPDTFLCRSATGVVNVGSSAGGTQGTINAAFANFTGVNLPSSLVANAVLKFGSSAGLSGNAGTIYAGNGTVADNSAIFSAYKYSTQGVCNSPASPAVCGSATAGGVVIAAGATTVTVNTTAVTGNSQILLTGDDSIGTLLGVTCNSTLSTALAGIGVTARAAGTSFTITTLGTVAVNPMCISYHIIN